MLLALLVVAALSADKYQSSVAHTQDAAAKIWYLKGPDGGEPRIVLQQSEERMPEPKISPKHGWIFEWVIAGLGRQEGGDTPYRARVRVFSQMRKAEDDPAPLVARMAMRLWDFNFRKISFDHNPYINLGIVDFYLCFGGKAGGEQLLDMDKQGGNEQRVNTIYIYAVQTFTDPIEMAREVAHEYGHATLPAIGGFSEPEPWANGYLGEKLFLKWMRDEIVAGRLSPQDCMGATADQLKTWVAKNVDPLVERAATSGPDVSLLAKPGKEAMEHYLGLVLWAEAMLPSKVFGRSIKLTGSTAALDYPKAIVAAASEVERLVLGIPESLRNRKVWIPVGKGNIVGKVDEVARRGDWVQVVPRDGAIVVNNPKLDP